MRLQFFKLCLFCMFCLLSSVAFAEDTLPSYNVGIVTDGDTQKDREILALYQKELQLLATGEYTIKFPKSMVLSGQDSREGAKKAMARLYKDPNVNLILALGPISSSLVYEGENPPKPVVAPYVVDSLVERDNAHPRSNLAYIDSMFYLESDLLSFQKIASFQNLTIITDSRDLTAIPQLETFAQRLADKYSITINTIKATDSAESVLAELSPDTDAVMIATLYHFSGIETARLLQRFIVQKIPSYAIWDIDLVNQGLLMGDAPEDQQENLARRSAISVQDILLGEEAGTLEVHFTRGRELTINMETARALEIYPSLAVMTGANLLHQARRDITRRLNLQQAVNEALEKNLEFLAADQTVLAGQFAVNEARSPLLPQISIGTGARAIDTDRAQMSIGTTPELAWTGVASGTQQIYSERSWAGYAIEQHLQTGREMDRDSVQLDTIFQVSVAYFNVLRAKAIEQLEKDNLKLSQANLKRAQIRLSTGVAGPDEVYRWETKNAADSREVLNKESFTLDTMQNLNRILNRPLQQMFVAEETDLSDPLLIGGNRFFLKLVENPKHLQSFRTFAIDEALRLRPELKSLDALIAAKERRTTSSKREFWVPDFSLEGKVEQYFAEDGSGQRNDFEDGLDDTDWQVGVYARLPLFEGGRKSASLSKNQKELLKLKIDRRAAAERISQQTLYSLNRTRASYPGISLAREGADSAKKNLDLITDSYVQGIKSIIELLDAQTQALHGNQAATNAVYDFLIDLMGVQRAMGSFIIFLPPEESTVWQDRVNQFLQ